MDDHGAVSEVRGCGWLKREILVEVAGPLGQLWWRHTKGRGDGDSLCGEGSDGLDAAMLAREISSLTALGLGGIARRLLTPDIGIEVGESSGAVAAQGNGLVVDVVDEGATDFGQTADGDAETDASTVRRGLCDEAPTHGAGVAVRKGGDELHAFWIAVDDGSILSGLSEGESREGDEGEDGREHAVQDSRVSEERMKGW